MTDVTVTVPSVETDEVYSNPCIIDTVVMNFRLYLFDANLNPFNEVHFESLLGGNVSQIKHFILRNGGVNPVNATIQMVESESQVGLDLETYLSCYISTDQVTWEKELPLTVNGGTDLDFYLRYQPPSNASVGEKQWSMHVDLPSGVADQISNNSFTVTSTSASDETNVEITVTIPYAVEVMKTDFGDIRFYEGLTELDYHLKEKTDGISAIFVIKIPSFGAGEEKEITVYAGDPEATTTSDPDNVYLFYDDFPGTSIDTTKWPTRSGTYTITDGVLSLTNGVLTPNLTFSPPFSVEMVLAGISGQADWFDVGLVYAGGWGDVKFLGYRCTSGNWADLYLHSDGCTNVTRTLTFPTSLEMKVISNAVYDNYQDGVWYQGRSDGSYSSPWAITLIAGWYRPSTIKVETFIVHKYPTSEPIISDLGQWSLGVNDKEIKAGILFSEGVLEGEETGQVKHGLEIDGHIYF